MLFKLLDKVGETIFAADAVRPKLIVEAKVYRACPACGHSGIVNNKYHEDFCPQCGQTRPPIEDKGVIYNNNPWWLFKRKVLRKLGRNV